MCGGGGGGGGSSQPVTPAASVQAATPLSRNTVTAAQAGSTSAAKAREARSVGKKPMRVGLDVSVANVGGNGATGLNIPIIKG